MTIRCIAFDLDDTLWECQPVIERAEARYYAWLQSVYPKICEKYSAEELVEHRMSFMRTLPEYRHNLTYLRKHWMKSLMDEFGYDYDQIDAGFDVFWLARNEVTFYDGSLENLQSLATRYSLGVISNGNADVHHIGVGHLFDFVISSEKAGVAKPHADIFHQALKLANVAKHEAVYVGDDPERDIVGAQQAGMKAIWFNPKLKPWPGGLAPYAVIQHLDELEDIITRI